jgi:neutral cholesterol ester hydrolase 1
VRQPSIQVLLVPCLQAIDFNTPSYQREADNTFLPRYWMATYWLWYARGFHDSQLIDVLLKNGHTSPDFKTSSTAQRTDHQLLPQKYFHPSYIPNAVNFGDKSVWNELEAVFLDPYYSPLLAGNLSNLPPAYIATADFDVLRDDGIIYARRLANDGVAVEHRNYERGYHAMFGDYTRFRLAKTVFNDLITFLLMQL